MEVALEEIARKYLNVPTLATRNSDALDFHECAVWSLKEALEAAYLAGARDAHRPSDQAQNDGSSH